MVDIKITTVLLVRFMGGEFVAQTRDVNRIGSWRGHTVSLVGGCWARQTSSHVRLPILLQFHRTSQEQKKCHSTRYFKYIWFEPFAGRNDYELRGSELLYSTDGELDCTFLAIHSSHSSEYCHEVGKQDRAVWDETELYPLIIVMAEVTPFEFEAEINFRESKMCC